MKIFMTILFAICAGFVGACAQGNGSIGEVTSSQNGFRFFDKEVQERFVARLRVEGIVHTMRADGTILYNPKDEARVGQIRMSVLEDSYVPSAHFTDDALEQRFVDQLKSHGIRFGLQEKDGKRWITWSEHDDQAVEKIRKLILNSK